MDAESLKGLNNPLAVIAILTLVFGFAMMGLRELMWFIKGAKKTTPMDKMGDAFEKLNSNMQAISENLKMMNEGMKHNRALEDHEHDEILKGVERIERKIT